MKELIPREMIERNIFLVRGHKVMPDKHLAELYGVETRALNQAVRRNSKRFPRDFMILLTRKEVGRISQIVTSLKFSKRVHAFTEQGVAMLSSVLNSERAIQVNIAVMRVFVKLRKMLSQNRMLARKLGELEDRIGRHDEDIQAIFHAIRELMMPPDPPKRKVGFHI